MDKKTLLFQFFVTFLNKMFLFECIFLPICNKFSEQNCFNKPNKPDQYGYQQNQILPSIFRLGHSISLKRKMTLVSLLINH